MHVLFPFFFLCKLSRATYGRIQKNPNRAVFRVQEKFKSKSSSRNNCLIIVPLPRAVRCSRQPLKGQFPLEAKTLETSDVFLAICWGVLLKKMYRLSRYPGSTAVGNHRQCHSQSNFRSEIPKPNWLSSQDNSK